MNEAKVDDLLRAWLKSELVTVDGERYALTRLDLEAKAMFFGGRPPTVGPTVNHTIVAEMTHVSSYGDTQSLEGSVSVDGTVRWAWAWGESPRVGVVSTARD